MANGNLTLSETGRLLRRRIRVPTMQRRAKSDGVVTLGERVRIRTAQTGKAIGSGAPSTTEPQDAKSGPAMPSGSNAERGRRQRPWCKRLPLSFRAARRALLWRQPAAAHGLSFPSATFPAAVIHYSSTATALANHPIRLGTDHDRAGLPARSGAQTVPGTICLDCCQMASGGCDRCQDCGSARVVSHPELEALAIAHVDCDAFYASVEKRDRPELREVPLIVGHPGGRGVVTTACYRARQFGVRSAMPMFKARELCPAATIIPPDMAKYKRVSADIRAIFQAATMQIEPVSLDEAYLDLSNEHRITDRPPAQALADIASRVESEIGVTVSIGLSANKFLAKLASEMKKPRGFSVIGRAEARELLSLLPVSKINGVGAAMAAKLEANGIRTVGDLQGLSEMQLVTQYGKFGRRLARYAVGDDDRSVTPDRPAKSISAETTFARDVGAAEALAAAVAPLCARVAVQLQRKGLAGGTVVLKLKTADFRIVSRSRRLASPTQREDVLAVAARALIEKEADGRLFRLVGIGADELRPASEADPPDLFQDARHKRG